jgi:hypothetical protein
VKYGFCYRADVSFEQDDDTGATAVLRDRRTYRYRAHAAGADYLISRRTESHNSSISDDA